MGTKATDKELPQRAVDLKKNAIGRKRVEYEWSEKEEKYREIISNLPGTDYQFTFNKDGFFSSPPLNERACLTLDILPRGDMTEPDSLFDIIAKDDLDSICQSIAESARNMKVWSQEFRITANNGYMKWVRGTFSPHPLPDGEILWNGVILDISTRVRAEEALRQAQTDLKRRIEKRTDELVVANESLKQEIEKRKQAEEALRESEERFRVVVEESPIGVSIISSHGHYKYMNLKFIEIFGYTLEDIPTGRDWFNKAYPDKEYRNQVISTWMNDFGDTKAGDYRDRVFNVTCKDDSEKAIRFTPVTLETGDQLVIYEDISERKQLEAQLQIAQKMEALGTLAGGIAHNFNNLLMGVLGNTSLLLLEASFSDQNYERLKTIEKLVESGSKLTEQLLGYARGGRYEPTSVNLNALIRETSHTFGITKRDITIHPEFAENLGEIRADQGQIEQVMWNLYVNAADAMPESGDLFLKTARVTDKEIGGKSSKIKPGTYALVTVRDTGTGMEKNTMKRIFDPFFTTKGLSKGTGLGLASVYGIIKAHGGYIDVQSEKGQGTTFRLYLPVSKINVGKASKSSEEITEGSGTILLVDDEEMVLNVGLEMLKRLGYAVLGAKSGREAVELFRENKDTIDLIILDMIMPGMGGRETHYKIKQIKPDINVLLSTGYGVNSQTTEILEGGFDGFIQKPFGIIQLSQKIGEILKIGPHN